MQVHESCVWSIHSMLQPCSWFEIRVVLFYHGLTGLACLFPPSFFPLPYLSVVGCLWAMFRDTVFPLPYLAQGEPTRRQGEPGRLATSPCGGVPRFSEYFLFHNNFSPELLGNYLQFLEYFLLFWNIFFFIALSPFGLVSCLIWPTN